MPQLDPPHWSPDQFDVDRTKSLGAFVASWGAEGTNRYQGIVAEYASQLDRLFIASHDLVELSGATFTDDASLVQPARFLTAPPVSADDLTTLIGGNISGKAPDKDRATQAAKIIRSAWDPLRFPWIEATRSPTKAERRTAILWTASIWAIEAMRTLKRNESSRQQEDLVSRTLEGAGYTRIPRAGSSTLTILNAVASRARRCWAVRRATCRCGYMTDACSPLSAKCLTRPSTPESASIRRLERTRRTGARTLVRRLSRPRYSPACIHSVTLSSPRIIRASRSSGRPLSAFVQADGPNPT